MRQQPNCGACGGCICWCFSTCIPIHTRAIKIIRKGSTPVHGEILATCIPACFSVFCRSLRCNTACNSVYWLQQEGRSGGHVLQVRVFNCRDHPLQPLTTSTDHANFNQPQLFGTGCTRRRRRAHPANKQLEQPCAAPAAQGCSSCLLEQPCADSLWMVSYSFCLHGHVYNTITEDDGGRRRTEHCTMSQSVLRSCASHSHASLQHGHAGIIAPLHLGDSGGQHQQQAAGHLQAVGQPGYG